METIQFVIYAYRPKGNNQLGLHALLHIIISFVCLYFHQLENRTGEHEKSNKIVFFSFPCLPRS